MELVEIDHIGLEPAQRGVAGPAHVAGTAVGHDVLVAHEQTALRGEEGLGPASPERPADEQLVGEGPVHVGGVEQLDARVQCGVHGPHGAVTPLLRRAVGPAHRHTAQPDRAHGERRRTDSPALQLPEPSLGPVITGPTSTPK